LRNYAKRTAKADTNAASVIGSISKGILGILTSSHKTSRPSAILLSRMEATTLTVALLIVALTTVAITWLFWRELR
jgi:hypothetical protein